MISEEIFEVIGDKDGPTSIILAGVHGDEKCGIEAAEKVLPDLRIDCGRVLWGFGNPRAILANKRMTEANLNRMFDSDDRLSDADKKSYEYERAQKLKVYLGKAEALLDIHGSRTPHSAPFLICEENAKDVAKYLPVELIVSGFDDVEPGGTDYYMNKTGKIGICIECGFIDDPLSVEVAERAIYAFLKARGHIPGSPEEDAKSHIRMRSLYRTKTNLALAREFKDFEELPGGELIGTDGETEVRTEKPGIILFARNRKVAGEEGFLFGEKKADLP